MDLVPREFNKIWNIFIKPLIICGDDYTPAWSGVMRAVNEFFGEKIKVVGNQQWWVKL